MNEGKQIAEDSNSPQRGHAAHKQLLKKHRRSHAWVSGFFLIVHLLCILMPLGIIVTWSFTASWPWPELLPQEFSSRGLVELFSPRQGLGLVLGQSVGIALGTALLSTVIATCAARALAFHDFFGKELFRFASVLPFLIPSTVFAMGIQVLFIRAGLANTVLGVILAHTIVSLPYAIAIMGEVIIAAGMRLEQQARVLGASPLRTCLHVQVPQLLPGILSAVSMVYIISFSQYFLTLLIGGGAVKTLATVMFPFLTSGDRTIASAYGLVFLLATLVVFFLFELLLKRFANREVSYFEG